jgi:hypothetical protein
MNSSREKENIVEKKTQTPKSRIMPRYKKIVNSAKSYKHALQYFLEIVS